MFVDQTLYHGRPVSGQRLDKELRCYDLLDRLGLAYDRADHDAADTIEACAAVEDVLEAGICKNLFLTNRQQTAFYLLLMPGHKPFRTKDLSHADRQRAAVVRIAGAYARAAGHHARLRERAGADERS